MPRVRSSPQEVRLSFVPQGGPFGLGHAVWCAREAVGDAPFAVVLPRRSDGPRVPCRPRSRLSMPSTRRGSWRSRRFHAKIPGATGVVDVGGELEPREPDRVHRRENRLPTRRPRTSRSSAGTCSMLRSWTILESTGPGSGGEIQLTDAIAVLAASEPVLASRFPGKRYDCGNRAGWLRATVALALAGARPSDRFPRDPRVASGDAGAHPPGPRP